MSPYLLAPKIAHGPDALDELGELAGRSVALLVDHALDATGGVARVRDRLDRSGLSITVVPWDGGEPTLSTVEALATRWRAVAPEWIVAAGGGGAIEAAKAAWVRLARPDLPLAGITPLTELGLRAPTRFVAIPTTSGSGSEAGWTALVRGADGGTIEVASRELVADWALLDPTLTVPLPVDRTVDTAAEAIGQAVEALLSEWSNPFADAFAREAIATAFAALPQVHARPDDLDGRAELQRAATFAGLAAANAQRGAAHALALALVPTTGLPYGRLLGILLPYVSEFNYPSDREKRTRSAGVLGPMAGKDRSALADRLRSLLLPLGIPRTLAAAGCAREALARDRAAIVARARASSATVANPRVPTAEEYGRLLDAAVDGTAVMF